MNKDDSKTVIVLGMHRSGTSMTAAILNELGVNMGENLYVNYIANPIGHFEDMNFIILNRKILKTAGGNWEKPPTWKAILMQKNKFKDEIKSLISQYKLKIWGWKDPRTSITIELYLPYIKNPYFIICHRNAYEVAKSLKTRNNFEIEKGIKLKKIYDEHIFNFFERNKNLKKLDCYYSDAINNSHKYVDNIIEFLGLNVDNQKRKKAIDTILTKKELENLITQVFVDI